MAQGVTQFTNHTNRDLADARANLLDLFRGWHRFRSINQSIIPSTNQSINPSIHQPINRSTNQQGNSVFDTCVFGRVFGNGSQEVSEGFLNLHLQSFMQAPQILQTTAHLLKFCNRQDQLRNNSAPRCGVPCFAMSTAQHSTAQHSTAQHSTAQHSTV